MDIMGLTAVELGKKIKAKEISVRKPRRRIWIRLKR